MFIKIDGKRLAELKLQHLMQLISNSKEKMKLDIIQIGEHPPSAIYVRNKQKMAQEAGIESELHLFPAGSFLSVEDKIVELNNDDRVTGIMIQTPMIGLDSVSEQLILLNSLNHKKDVDGLTASNLGELIQVRDYNYFDTRDFFIPATVLGILDSLALGFLIKMSRVDIITSYEVFSEYKAFFYEAKLKFLSDQLKGRNIMIINDSSILGRPLSMILTTLGGTVRLAHIHTKNVQSLIDESNIVISGVGQKGIWKFSTGSKIEIVVDAGISVENGATFGDFDFSGQEMVDASAYENLSRSGGGASVLDQKVFITPVPGGVGPLTIQNLLENVRRAKNIII